MNATRVAVVGAGLAGLAAAIGLKRRGFRPVVYEAGDHPGGRAASMAGPWGICDLGAWSLSDGAIGLLGLASQAGMRDQVVPVPLSLGRIGPDGRIAAAGLTQQLSMLRRGVVGLRAGLALRRAMADAAGPKGPGGASWGGLGPDEPLAAYACRRLHSACVKELLRPLCGLFFLQPPETVSRDAFLGLLAALPRMRICVFRRGMGSLAAALAGQLQVRYRARVLAVVPGQGGVTLTLAGGEQHAYPAVVLAVPFPAAAAMAGASLPAALTAAGGALAYEPAMVVHLALGRRLDGEALLVLPPRCEPDPMLSGVIMDRLKSAERVAPGKELLSLYVAPQHVGEAMAQDDATVVRRCMVSLERWMPGTARQAEGWRVQRWPVGGARFDPNYVPAATAVARQAEPWAQRTGVFLTGDYLGASNAEGVVQAGLATARACASWLSRGGSG